MDSELTMVVDSKFNSILKEIQQSKLNFVISLTPFSANITLKKSTQVDKNGAHISPAPPSFLLLEQSLREKIRADEEIEQLKSALSSSNKYYNDLLEENRILNEKLCTINEVLRSSHNDNELLDKKLSIKENEIAKILCEKSTLKEELSLLKKQCTEAAFNSDNEISSLKESLKMKDKEIHNLKLKYSNSRDTVTNIKSELSCVKSSKQMLEGNIKKLELKTSKLQSRKVQHSMQVQTISTIDTPYSISEPLPPIFGSDLCYRSKSVFLSKSQPDLSQVLWVTRTKEDTLQEEAEQALDYLYDLEVATFYEDARRKAIQRRCDVDPDSG